MNERDRDRRKDPGKAGTAPMPRGALSRGLRMGGALLGAFGKTAGGRLFGETDERAAAAGEQLASVLGQMKGLSMKLGQMLSYAGPSMPETFRTALARLQHQAPAMAKEVVARTVEEDLGEPPERSFAEWEDAPLAAASIGQVHRARLHDGRWVAVKVRYPAIDDAIRDDLKNAELLGRVLALAAPALDAQALMAELRERALEECDYRREAEHQTAFRRLFAAKERVIVPEVHPRYSSERVLTTDLIEGLRFQSFVDSAPADERNRAAEAIHDFAFRSIFEFGTLNCDPHPGNYLFTPQGVAFLDFGCVRRFSGELVHTWKKMLRSALEQDRTRFREAVVELGFAGRPEAFDFDAHYSQYLSLIRPWLSEEQSSLTPELVARSYRTLLVSNPNRSKMNLPRELLFANRLQWGLYSVLAELRATLPLRERILDILYEPGETRPPPFSDSELRRSLDQPERR